MKKLVAFMILSGTLLMLASCASDNDTSGTPTEKPVVEETVNPTTPAPADEMQKGETEAENTQNPNDEGPLMKRLSDFPIAKSVGNLEGKMLNDFDTAEKTANVFFETDARIRSAILVNNGVLYIGCEDKSFIAVDINTKKQLWRYVPEDAVQSLPVFSDGVILFNAGNSLYGLNGDNGDEIFKVTHESNTKTRLSHESYSYNEASTAVSDGVAYYNALNGDLVAVDIQKGEIIWTIPAINEGAAGSGVNIYDEKLYWVDNSGALCCADINTREMIFILELNDTIYAPMHINDGKIYLAGRRCRIFCVDAQNGDVIWSSFADDNTTWFSGGSVCIGDMVYTGTSDRHALFSFNKNTGEFNRMYPTQANVYTQPVLNDQHVILAATDVYSMRKSYVMEFDTENHTLLWQAYIEDGVLSSPAVYDGVVYFGSESGRVYSIDLK